VCDIPPLLARYIYIDLVDRNEDEARVVLIEGVREGRLKRPAPFPGVDSPQTAPTTPAFTAVFPGPQQFSVASPLDGEQAVLIKSRRRCCVCYALERTDSVCDGKIAHLDYNPRNARENNLAWLCLKHYGEYQRVRGLSASEVPLLPGLSEAEIQAYRQLLYNHIVELDTTRGTTVFELSIKNDSALRTRDGQAANAEAIAAILHKLEVELRSPIRTVCVYLGPITLVMESSKLTFKWCLAAFRAGTLSTLIGADVSAVTFRCGWQPSRPVGHSGSTSLILLNLKDRSEESYRFEKYEKGRRSWWKYLALVPLLLLFLVPTVKHWCGVGLSLLHAPESLKAVDLQDPYISISEPSPGREVVRGETVTLGGRLNRNCRGCSGLVFVYVDTVAGPVRAEVEGESWTLRNAQYNEAFPVGPGTIWVGRFTAPILGKTVRPQAVASAEVTVMVLPRKK